MKSNVVKVVMWGRTVGYIYWDKARKRGVFQYDDAYVKDGLDVAPFTMSLASERSKKEMVWYGESDKLYQGLPAMIADALPDRWGNAIFDAWLRDHHIRHSDVNPVDRLSFTGKRALGALEFEPAHSLGDDLAFDVDVQGLYNFAREVLSAREAVSLTGDRSLLWQDLVELGTSPGGKRPKAIVALHPGTGEIKSGQSTVPEGFVHYILKYDDSSFFPFTKMEYVYYKMSTAAGIEMMPSMLREFGGVTHFLTRRFDRDGNRKIHTQTLAAMCPGADSYDDLFKVIRRLALPYDASEQQYLRMVFNVLSGNIDDHSKNFSFCMDERGEWTLSPAYDITYSIDNSAPAYMNRHSLLVNGKDSDISLKDVLEVGKRNDIRNARELIGQVKEALAGFDTMASGLGIDTEVIAMVKKEINSRILNLY